MNSIKNNIWNVSRLFFHVCYIAGSIVPLTSLGGISMLTPPGDVDQCRSNLAAVSKAIDHYRHQNHRFPKELRDLVPKYLPNPSYLKCPIDRQGLSQESVLPSSKPVAAGAYVYEFEPGPLTNGLAQGLSITLQSWRQLQMGKIGSQLPIVRCTNHVRPLSLSFGGEIRESGPEWESDFASVVHPDEMRLDFLLAEYVHLRVVRIPARDSSLPLELVDLASYYNGSPTGWMEAVEDKGLADFMTNLTIVDGISFDVRGVIQLGSKHFAMPGWPAMVTNITLGLNCEGLAFLHGTVNGAGEDEVVGHYVIHFEDSSTNVLPITYGLHLLAWKESDLENIKSWETRQKDHTSGKISVIQKGGTRLYVFYWTNPHPNLRIQYIDFVSAMTQSSPFLAAVSVAPVKQVEEMGTFSVPDTH